MNQSPVEFSLDPKVISAIINAIAEMNADPRYEFKFEKFSDRHLAVWAPDPFHFYLLGTRTQEIYKKYHPVA